MPETNLLSKVVAVVVACLVIWVLVVLRTVKERWVRLPFGGERFSSLPPKRNETDDDEIDDAEA